MKKSIFLLIIFTALIICTASAMGPEEVVYDSRVSAYREATYVDFGTVKVTSLAKLEGFLDQLPALQKCDMFETTMTLEWADELSRRYPDVEFGWTFVITCNNKGPHVIRTDMTVFSTLHNNKSTAHTSRDFECLKYCRHMLALDLGHNGLTSLDFLKYMPELRVLIIGRNQINDISAVGHCTKLEYLEAFSNRIGSVAPLLNCTNLMDLNIPNNRISDIELLGQIKSLRRVWAFNYAWSTMDRSLVEANVKSALRSALPGCTFDWTSSGTGGTWRTTNGDSKGTRTPHYAVIYEMFNTGVYIPFAESAPLE